MVTRKKETIEHHIPFERETKHDPFQIRSRFKNSSQNEEIKKALGPLHP